MLDLLIPFAEGTRDPVEQAYLVYALEGLSAIDTGVQVEPLLTAGARALLGDTTTGCIDDIANDFQRHHVDRLLDTDAATKDRLGKELGRYGNPDHARSAEPILITQGLADRDVPAVATSALDSRLCALGDRVEYRLLEKPNHNILEHHGSPPRSRSSTTGSPRASRMNPLHELQTDSVMAESDLELALGASLARPPAVGATEPEAFRLVAVGEEVGLQPEPLEVTDAPAARSSSYA